MPTAGLRQQGRYCIEHPKTCSQQNAVTPQIVDKCENGCVQVRQCVSVTKSSAKCSTTDALNVRPNHGATSPRAMNASERLRYAMTTAREACVNRKIAFSRLKAAD